MFWSPASPAPSSLYAVSSDLGKLDSIFLKTCIFQEAYGNACCFCGFFGSQLDRWPPGTSSEKILPGCRVSCAQQVKNLGPPSPISLKTLESTVYAMLQIQMIQKHTNHPRNSPIESLSEGAILLIQAALITLGILPMYHLGPSFTGISLISGEIPPKPKCRPPTLSLWSTSHIPFE